MILFISFHLSVLIPETKLHGARESPLLAVCPVFGHKPGTVPFSDHEHVPGLFVQIVGVKPHFYCRGKSLIRSGSELWV